ncbi:VCBS domain-containing protein [uncultured Kiloniella sp.]|uniref:VCBS domain-containing protein n=1 Tax=uncultured Kiloniella sp. TaxID=1133091 RepID=UPI0026381060|nr:VCBS domain-containing protein [uncultured Kiloniella sp.]
MTEGFATTGNETVSGEEGQDLLVGQAASAIEITAPAGGETKTVSLERGQTATLNFDATAATPVLEGNDFVLTFDSNGDGSADSRIVFQNLVEDAQGADAPVLVIGGIELSAGLLIGQAQALVDGETLETAAGAGAGPQGGGGSTYDENLGDIIDLLQAQQGLGGTGLEFGLLAGAEDISDPAEGTFDLSFLTVTTEIPDDGGEGGENFVSGTFSGGFEDWQPNQHLGDESTYPMQVEFNFTPADNETLDSVVINALPDGVTLYIGGTDAANIFAGSFPVTILPEDYDAIFILPPADSDADITVNAIANISDPDSGDSASIPATAVAVVDAAADKPVFNDDGGLNGDGLVDMYLLQDLTGSFSNDLANVRTAMSGLIGKIDGGEFSADVHLGTGSFKDKPLSPYGDRSDYVFQNAENVTDDLAAVQSAVDGFSATGGNDGPEGQIEALLNLAQNASDLGFRSGAAKYVVLTTDNSFHKAGDASSLGANDGDGDLTADLDEDYPSLAQLKAALDASGIVPIFMATSGYVSEYQALVDYLGVGEVHELTSDSSNLLANILTSGGTGSNPEDNVYDEQAEVTVPVDVTFGDYTDGSEVHTIVLSGIPSDWIPTFAYEFTVDGLADGQNPGDIGLNTTYSITIDVTDLDDVGGLVDIDLTFNPQDWTSSRWSDGSSHDDGDATIGLKAIAVETNLSGDELTDLNNRAETDGSHTIKVIEDIPEVQGVTFTHDETKGVDAGSGDVAALNAAVAAALVASTVGVHGSVIGQAEAEVAHDFKTDGPTTPTDASDVGTEKLHFQDYDSFEVPGMTAGGEGDENSSPIFLTRDDANPYIVWGLDDEGNAVFSVHLEQPTTSSGTATMTFVQYQQINHSIGGDNSAGEHDDALSFTLDYVAIDGEGDVSDPATATITVEDDGPSVNPIETNAMDESDGSMAHGIHSLVGVTEPVTITLDKLANVDSAGYNSSYGYFLVDIDGNPISGEVVWANVKDHDNDATDTVVTIDPAAHPDAYGFGFFIIPDGADRNPSLTDGTAVTFDNAGGTGSWTASTSGGALSGAGAPAFFSDPELNSDGADHESDNAVDGNSNWEDLLIPNGDGDHNDVNLNVTIDGANPAPCGHVTGNLTFDVGTDIVASTLTLTAASGAQINSDGVPVTLTPSADGSQIVATTVSGDLVYVVRLVDVDMAAGTASYEFFQFRQFDHPENPDNYDETIAVNFNVVVTDGDGDTATQLLTINHDDDGLLAVDDNNVGDLVKEDVDSTANGNVLDNDTIGKDGVVVTTTSEMTGTFGSVSIGADGQYTYNLNNAAANVQALADGEVVYDTFTYEIQDGDGDTSTAELKIKITGTNDAPVAVDDGVLPAGVPITGTVPDFELTKADSERTLGTSFGAQNAGRPVTITFDAETGGSWDPFGGNQDTFTVEINGVEVLVTHDRGTNSYSFDVVTKDDGGIEIKFFGDITGGDESLTISNLIAIRGPGWPDGSLTTDENAALTVDVLANDTDIDNGDNPSTFSLDSVSFASGLPADQGATPADVTVVGNKLFFEPGTAFDYLGEGETATVVVDYTMSDDSGASASATATIVVTGSNDAPILTPVTLLTNNENDFSFEGDLLARYGSDAEGDEIVISPDQINVGSDRNHFDYVGSDGTDYTYGTVDISRQRGDRVTGTDADEILVGRDMIEVNRTVTANVKGSSSYQQSNFFNFSFNTLAVGEFVTSITIDLRGGKDTDAFFDFDGSSSYGPVIGSETSGIDDADISFNDNGGNQSSLTISFADGAFGNGNVLSFGADTDYLRDDDANSFAAREVTFSVTLSDGTVLDGEYAAVRGSNESKGVVSDTKLVPVDDVLDGGAGDDTLMGLAGDDILNGGAGDDVLIGGAGDDTFAFSLAGAAASGGDGNDVISDFDAANDILHFSDVVDTGAAGLDIDDLNAMVSGIVNNGDGNDVVVNFNNGASITFQGLGSSSSIIDSIDDLVNDPATQIIVD